MRSRAAGLSSECNLGVFAAGGALNPVTDAVFPMPHVNDGSCRSLFTNSSRSAAKRGASETEQIANFSEEVNRDFARHLAEAECPREIVTCPRNSDESNLIVVNSQKCAAQFPPINLNLRAIL